MEITGLSMYYSNIRAISSCSYNSTILINIIFTTLALLPVCCRACGYNRCVRSVATRESHQRALKEILPLFIFLSYTCFAIISLVLAAVYCNLIPIIALPRLSGLFLALSFVTHLCILGKAKLKIAENK